jgi:hypothetical protein
MFLLIFFMKLFFRIRTPVIFTKFCFSGVLIRKNLCVLSVFVYPVKFRRTAVGVFNRGGSGFVFSGDLSAGRNWTVMVVPLVSMQPFSVLQYLQASTFPAHDVCGLFKMVSLREYFDADEIKSLSAGVELIRLF